MKSTDNADLAEKQCLGDGTERHFEDILNSRTFEKSHTLKALLGYLWEHRNDGVNEYTIGVDALKRNPDFDPRFDATVRVRIARLRQKLKEYYEQEGRASPWHIAIPPGQHLPQVQLSPMPPDAVAAVEIPRRSPGRIFYLLSGLSPILAVSCFLLYLQATRLSSSPVAGRPPVTLPAIWRSFFSNGKPAALFIPAPTFFEWKDSNVKMRDTTVTSFDELDRSIELRSHVVRFGPPTLMDNYTVTSDALAAVKLTQYLERAGRTVDVHSSAELSLDSLEDKNVILLGIPNTSRQIREVMQKTNFRYGGGVVYNRDPRPGESPRYDSISLSHDRKICPGVIAIVPGMRNEQHILMLSESRTQLLAAALVSPAALKILDETLKNNGRPPFFELVLQVEAEGAAALRAWPVAFRTISASDWR